MRLEIRPLAEAVGQIICHNIADAQGRKALSKGRVLRAEDLPRLAELGLRELRVAVLDPGDLHEDEAARHLAAAVAGPGVEATEPHTGRVNLRAAAAGPLAVDADALLAINELDGLTVATLPAHTLVRPGTTLATIKIIPFAVPGAELERAEAIGRTAGGVLRVAALRLRSVGVILVSSPAARARVERGVYPAIESRVRELGGTVIGPYSVAPDEQAVAAALAELRTLGAELIITAGETSVVDIEDVTPRGVRLAGGQVEHYGAPVEPGNLLLLAYLGDGTNEAGLPVLGAPGCVRSRDANIVDLLLPRLMAGERIGRRDILTLGHGGLLG